MLGKRMSFGWYSSQDLEAYYQVLEKMPDFTPDNQDDFVLINENAGGFHYSGLHEGYHLVTIDSEEAING